MSYLEQGIRGEPQGHPFLFAENGKQINRSQKIWMGSKQQINFNDTLYESCLFNYFSDRVHCRLQ